LEGGTGGWESGNLNANTMMIWNRIWRWTADSIEGRSIFDITLTEDDLPFMMETQDLLVNVLITIFRADGWENKTRCGHKFRRGEIELNIHKKLTY